MHQPRPSPSPPSPSPLPPQPQPLDDYLISSLITSKSLSEPTRKLLILDLNGTLLLRSPRGPKSYRGQYHQRPAPRRVLPRPYLTALRAYLFAPQTQIWLDVMVWSSAQPHSVEDMVLHAFGRDRDRLVATWARDTLGLTEDHYHRKVPTTKDLEKPWAALAPRRPTSPTTSSSSSSSSPSSSSSHSSHITTTTISYAHSAATTILLDDSHAKAALQPYNHLCVPEYTRALRNTDLAALQRQRQRPRGASQYEHAEIDPNADDEVRPRKRKRARKASDEEPDDAEWETQRHRKRAKREEGPSTSTAVEGEEEEEESFDQTLLAVIGILHAARVQSNIAGWFRAGSLLLLPPERADPDADDAAAKVWFEEADLVREWARRGRDAMRELGLEVRHGIER